jgi:hypothetical protein
VELTEQLVHSSARFARSVLEALPVEDHANFAPHASMALEHAMKAVLAKRHPALIAASDFDSLLHATRHAADARTPRHLMKTGTSSCARLIRERFRVPAGGEGIKARLRSQG